MLILQASILTYVHNHDDIYKLFDGVSNLPEDFEPVKIVSFGVVIKETDEYISIAQNYGTNPEQCCSLMTIPKGCIKKIRTIEEIIKDEK